MRCGTTASGRRAFARGGSRAGDRAPRPRSPVRRGWRRRAAGHPATSSFSRVLTQPGRANIGIEVTDKDGATGSTQVSVWVRSAVFGVFNGPNTASPELRDGESSLSFSTLAGQGTVSPTPAPGSIGAARFFVRLRPLSP